MTYEMVHTKNYSSMQQADAPTKNAHDTLVTVPVSTECPRASSNQDFRFS